MSLNPSAPGVYNLEVPTLPSSIAGVATAIPAFIGYVEKAELNGQPVLLNTPVRITSMLEYENTFGKAFSETYTIDIADISGSPVQRTITVNKTSSLSYRMYYNLQMYFANGGGPCYIVPVGFYYSPAGISTSDFLTGLDAIAKVDEPTLLLMPDALNLTPLANLKTVYDAALDQCNTLKDRFVIMDMKQTGNNNSNIATDANNFRNSTVGADNLKYGATYYPDLNTTLVFGFDPNLVHINSHTLDGDDIGDSANVIPFVDMVNIALEAAEQALAAAKMAAVTLTLADATFAAAIAAAASDAADNADTAGTSVTASWFATAVADATAANTAGSAALTAALAFAAPGGQDETNAAALISLLEDFVAAATTTLNDSNTALSDSQTDFIAGSMAYIQLHNPAVYASIVSQINTNLVELNPSGTMAGIYARVDADRGVWKAPANVSIRSIIGPSINITTSEQEGLNIDATSGKSINALRAFTGKGTLVWGARTLAGNDNEWRYINVRRLFNYVEESVAEATAFVVFEANNPVTWNKVSGMIESFLTGLWRDGALAGSVPKDAFFIRVGLGITMTTQDILEGRMIVEIGMAAVRPAEFIIIKFMHKLQEA